MMIPLAYLVVCLTMSATASEAVKQVVAPQTQFTADQPRILVESAIRAMPHPKTLLEQVGEPSVHEQEQKLGSVPIAGSQLAEHILFIASFDPDVWIAVWDMAKLEDKEFVEKLWFLNRLLTVRGSGEEDSGLKDYSFGERGLRIQLEVVRSIPESVNKLAVTGWTPKEELISWLKIRGRNPLAALHWVLRGGFQ